MNKEHAEGDQAKNYNFAVRLEMYKQAHETRRKWEGYIWQWGILVTAIVSIWAGYVSIASSYNLKHDAKTHYLAASDNSVVVSDNSAVYLSYNSKDQLFIRKTSVALLTVFMFSIFLNVYRARCLMKKIEITIEDFHKDCGLEKYPIVPVELDKDETTPLWQKISSTRVSVFAHLMIVLVFIYLFILEVFSK